jgi:hypothetical protein
MSLTKVIDRDQKYSHNWSLTDKNSGEKQQRQKGYYLGREKRYLDRQNQGRMS